MKCIILLILLIFVQWGFSLYEKDGQIILLNTNNFKDEVFSTEQVTMVEFFAPWCGHCKRLAPEYKRVAQNVKGLAKVAAIDCDDDANRSVCAAYNINGFPTLKLFPSQSVPDKKNPGQFKKIPKDYEGPRTAKSIVDFILGEIPSFVQPISNKNPTKKTLRLDEFLEKDNDTLPKVILFTNKEKTTPLYKALSVDFRNRMLLGEVRQTESTLSKRFGIVDLPKLVVIPVNQNEAILYDGKLNHHSLYDFLSKYALPSKEKTKNEEEKEQEKQDDQPFNPEIDKVETHSDLETYCLSKPTGLCIFTFLPLEPEFPESVTENENNISILRRVKGKLHKDLSRQIQLYYLWFNSLDDGAKKLIKDFKLSDVFPNLMILNANRKVYRPYLGPFDEDGIQNFIKDVVKGRGKSFEYDFLIAYVEPKVKKEQENREQTDGDTIYEAKKHDEL